jgi:hypothetical protein
MWCVGSPAAMAAQSASSPAVTTATMESSEKMSV